MSDDKCCFLCKSPWGCTTHGKCGHHQEARRRQYIEDHRRPGYADPTGDTAAANVDRERRRK